MAFMCGAGLWADVGYRFEEAMRLCMAGMNDSCPSVRDAFAIALGEMVAACRSQAAVEAVSAGQCNPSRAHLTSCYHFLCSYIMLREAVLNV